MKFYAYRVTQGEKETFGKISSDSKKSAKAAVKEIEGIGKVDLKEIKPGRFHIKTPNLF